MNRKNAFTMIELLTVIAIIAILSAIIFPVYTRAKDNANRSSDISSMRTLGSALLQYRVDQGGYPPALLGYATTYVVNGTTVPPANSLAGFLYPKRVDSIDVLRPIKNQSKPDAVTTAVWPTQASTAGGANQKFGPTTTVMVDRSQSSGTAESFYKISGYDVAEVSTGGTSKRNELRYSLFWTELGLGAGSANDDPRQLGYSDPPDNTVVTWNSMYRDYTGNSISIGRHEVVLLLGGGAKNADSREVAAKSWAANVK